eukprot:SM000050S16954  [mRNA]  locus=s50:20827:28162:+ [translate_table: standard]
MGRAGIGRRAGHPTLALAQLGDIVGRLGLVKVLIHSLRVQLGLFGKNGSGTANTALVYHNNTLYALHEGDKPYALRVLADGELETLGREDYDGQLTGSFTAHPKLDPDTGEAACRSELLWGGFPYVFDNMRPSRFGVLPRYAGSDATIRWFELPACAIFHTANAWEEGDEVVLYACRLPTMQLLNIGEGTPYESGKQRNELWQFRFNMKTGEAAQRQLGDFNTDFPRINDNYLGRTSKYAYASIFDDSLVKILGLVKFDLFKEPRLGTGPPVAGQGNVAGVFWHGPSRFGSEPVFVPASSDPNAPEDDGYLLNFVYDEANEYAPDHALHLSLGHSGGSFMVQP